MGEKEVGSVLVLNRLVFDRIEFHRLGMKNDREIKFKIQVKRRTGTILCFTYLERK